MIDVANIPYKSIVGWYNTLISNIDRALSIKDVKTKRSEIYTLCSDSFAYFVYIFAKDAYYGVPSRSALDFMINVAQHIHENATYNSEGKLVARPRNRFNILAPRGNAKSSLAGLYAVWQTLYRRERYIIVASSTYSTTKELFNEKIAKWFSDDAIKAVYNPQVEGINKTDLIVNDVKIKPVSIDQPIRGTAHREDRPTLFLGDDMQQDRQLRSASLRSAHRNNWERGFMPAARPLQSPIQSNVIMINTAVHPDSIAFTAQADPTYISAVHKAIISDGDSIRWEHFDKLIIDGKRDEAYDFYRHNEIEMLKGVRVNWASGEPYVLLRESRILNPLAFEYEKQNNPYDPSSALFASYLLDPINSRIKSDILFDFKDLKLSANNRFVAYIDPALGGDYTSITILCRQDSYFFVLGNFVTKTSQIDVQINEFLPWLAMWNDIAMQETSRSIVFGIEKVAFQEVLGSLLIEKVKHMGYTSLQKNIEIVYCPPIATRMNMDKRRAIMAILYQAGISASRILFNREGISSEFWAQLTGFPTHQNDDCPDSLASAIYLCSK